MAQLVTRIDKNLPREIDAMVDEGVASSRSGVVRIGLLQLIHRYRRARIGAKIVEG
jgi:Arc/MetJ-type ribon-helix-helix transcriptional regulator